MFKFFAVAFAALLAVVSAAPKAEPGIAYTAPLTYSAYSGYTGAAPIAYSSYAAPSIYSAGYAAAPLAYSSYAAPAVYV